MASQLRPVHAVTRATSLTAFRDASAAVDLGHSASPRRAESARDWRRISAFASIPIWRRRRRMARFRADRRCDAVPELRLAVDLASPCRRRTAAVPAIAVGRFADGRTAFIFPLAVDRSTGAPAMLVRPGSVRLQRAAVVARFFERITPDGFTALWGELWEKFDPIRSFATIGSNSRRCRKRSGLRPIHSSFSASYRTPTAPISRNWTAIGTVFYRAKRSSATRRRDRVKRRHMAEFGDIRMVTATTTDDARRTLEI